MPNTDETIVRMLMKILGPLIILEIYAATIASSSFSPAIPLLFFLFGLFPRDSLSNFL